jgi:Rv0078B-related antitoxin
MDPETALKLQIEAYCRMTGEERLAIALRLHELPCEITREGIRHQHPHASPEEVERLLHRRIALARELEN